MRLRRELTVTEAVFLIAVTFVLVRILLKGSIWNMRNHWEIERQKNLPPVLRVNR